MLYDKSPLPPKGSLREALFLTVWLKRNEAELLRTRVVAQMAVDLAEKGAETTAEAFKMLTHAMMPYTKKVQAETDEKMKQAMEREVKKGVIVFNAPTANPLRERAKEMSLPDEFRQKLSARKRLS